MQNHSKMLFDCHHWFKNLPNNFDIFKNRENQAIGISPVFNFASGKHVLAIYLNPTFTYKNWGLPEYT